MSAPSAIWIVVVRAQGCLELGRGKVEVPAFVQADIDRRAVVERQVPIDLAEELDAEQRHPDVLRRRELLADRARRQRGRRPGVGWVAFDDGDAAVERRVAPEEVGDRTADGAPADDRDVVVRAHTCRVRRTNGSSPRPGARRRRSGLNR